METELLTTDSIAHASTPEIIFNSLDSHQMLLHATVIPHNLALELATAACQRINSNKLDQFAVLTESPLNADANLLQPLQMDLTAAALTDTSTIRSHQAFYTKTNLVHATPSQEATQATAPVAHQEMRSSLPQPAMTTSIELDARHANSMPLQDRSIATVMEITTLIHQTQPLFNLLSHHSKNAHAKINQTVTAVFLETFGLLPNFHADLTVLNKKDATARTSPELSKNRELILFNKLT